MRRKPEEKLACGSQHGTTSHGKSVCNDCLWHGSRTTEELEAIPPGGACKHYDPEFSQAKGWKRRWGDDAVMGLPESIEILRREDAGRVEYLILGRKLRRPVKL
jgi:hypothetical protein